MNGAARMRSTVRHPRLARFGAALLSPLLVAACLPSGPTAAPTSGAKPTPNASPTAEPTQAAVATVPPTARPTIEPSAEPTIEPEPSLAPCPTARLLSVREFVEAPRSCFAGRDVLVFKGWLDEPGPLGFHPPLIWPIWLAYPEGGQTCDEQIADCFYSIALWQDVPLDPDHVCSDDEPYCSLFFPHSAPGTGLHFLPLEHWVIRPGHTDDPAAERCHWEYSPDIEPGSLDDAEAVEHCRTQFVVTEIDRADSP